MYYKVRFNHNIRLLLTLFLFTLVDWFIWTVQEESFLKSLHWKMKGLKPKIYNIIGNACLIYKLKQLVSKQWTKGRKPHTWDPTWQGGLCGRTWRSATPLGRPWTRPQFQSPCRTPRWAGCLRSLAACGPLEPLLYLSNIIIHFRELF